MKLRFAGDVELRTVAFRKHLDILQLKRLAGAKAEFDLPDRVIQLRKHQGRWSLGGSEQDVRGGKPAELDRSRNVVAEIRHDLCSFIPTREEGTSNVGIVEAMFRETETLHVVCAAEAVAHRLFSDG